MSARKPLVIVAGQVEQLQAGDTLDAPVSAPQTVVLTNDEGAATVVIGTPVYIDADDGAKQAKADSASTSDVVGLWLDASTAPGLSGTVITDGILTSTTAAWDIVTGDVGGLIAGNKYWLSSTAAGKLIKTPLASSSTGKYVAPVGKAISATELMVDIEETILL